MNFGKKDKDPYLPDYTAAWWGLPFSKERTAKPLILCQAQFWLLLGLPILRYTLHVISTIL